MTTPELLTAIDKSEAPKYLADDRYFAQPKHDGKRRGMERTPQGVYAFNKLGQPVPATGVIANELNKILCNDFEIDGEELRGGKYALYDIFRWNGLDIRSLPYEQRLALLELNFSGLNPAIVFVTETWRGTAEKMAALEAEYNDSAEGIVFKLKSAPHRPDRNGQHLKFKFYEEATFRVCDNKAPGVSSIGLELLQADGKWQHVGNTSTLGKGKPIAIGSFVEVKYLYAVRTDVAGKHFSVGIVQPTLKLDPVTKANTRDDVTERDCNFDQLRYRRERGVAKAA